MTTVEGLENRLGGAKSRRAEALKVARKAAAMRDKAKPGSEEFAAAMLELHTAQETYNEAHSEVWRISMTIELLTRHKPIAPPPSTRGPVRQV